MKINVNPFPYTPEDFMSFSPSKRLMIVRDYLAENPDVHNQDHWACVSFHCGTTLCAAGTAVTMAGGVLSFDSSTEAPAAKYAHMVRMPGVDEDEQIDDVAAAILGLEGPQHNLFYCTNEEFFDYAQQIIRENGE